MMNNSRFLRAALAAVCLIAPVAGHAATEQQSLEELRNTVVNLLQALVDQGVMTREKAQSLVAQAKDKAAAAAVAEGKVDAGAVRVPYIPEVVREQIRKEVAEEVKPGVVAGVVEQAKAEGWGIPGALPEWLARVKVAGDIRLRGQGDFFGRDNQPLYLNYQAINAAGGQTKAGINAFTNVSEDRYRMRVRARFGVEASLSPSLTAGVRLSTGSLQDPSSENQTLGNYGARYTTAFDQIWVRWDDKTAQGFTRLSVTGGRIPTPWFEPTDLVFHKDLPFEGVAATGRLGLGDGSAAQSQVFLTVGALPIQEVALSTRDKWLLGGQLGTSLRFGDEQRLKLAVGYYDFRNVQGVRNAFGLNNNDFTAPQWVQQGNTMFDIRNDLDPATNLFALASKYAVLDLSLGYELPLGRYSLSVAGDVVRNVGFKEAEVAALTGHPVQKRNKGYQMEAGFGDPALGAFGRWRAVLGYRYLQRDAVLDAFTDTDFHAGGTDARGYYLTGDFGLGARTFARLRYLSANEIDGFRYGVDVLQLDFNTSF
jgi:Putative porin